MIVLFALIGFLALWVGVVMLVSLLEQRMGPWGPE